MQKFWNQNESSWFGWRLGSITERERKEERHSESGTVLKVGQEKLTQKLPWGI